VCFNFICLSLLFIYLLFVCFIFLNEYFFIDLILFIFNDFLYGLLFMYVLCFLYLVYCWRNILIFFIFSFILKK